MARRDWSEGEVVAAVTDYLEMLADERRGTPYSKTAHRNRLLKKLDRRSQGSVEYKHQNISAALIALGFPYIDGYKPAWNYQKELLDEIVAVQVGANAGLRALVARDVQEIVRTPRVDNILEALAAPPKVRDPRYRAPTLAQERGPYSANYLAREAANQELGLAGEEFVVNYERARLAGLGKESLASKIQHVAKVRGDGDGFDILSYEADGGERLIEVKTTKYGIETPFFLSRNEVAVSQHRSDQFFLYRVFAFRSSPKLFLLKGSLLTTCTLTPSVYIGTVA